MSDFSKYVIEMLRASPNGLTSNDIAARLGTTAGNLSSRLSKLAAYGACLTDDCSHLSGLRQSGQRSDNVQTDPRRAPYALDKVFATRFFHSMGNAISPRGDS